MRSRRCLLVALAVAVAAVGCGSDPHEDASLARSDAADAGEDMPPTDDSVDLDKTSPSDPGEPETVVEHTSTIEDTDIGTTPGTVEYTGESWTRCGGCNVDTDDSSYYYGYVPGQSYTVRFTGVQIKVYAPDDLHGGTARVTVDGEPPATETVDFHTASTPADGLRWDSGMLADGEHTVAFTVEPGDPAVVLFDRAEVYTPVAGPAAGEPTDTTPPAEPPPGDTPPGGTTSGRTAAPALLGAGVGDPYELGAWLGHPVEIWETWQPHTWPEMEAVPTLGQYMTGAGPAPFNRRWTGEVSIAQPMWAAGENTGTCNSGANDQHMTNIANAVEAAGFGDAYIRLGWEMDGYWFGSINRAWEDPTGWVACWRRWHDILKGVSSGFKLVWSPNWGSNTEAGPFDVRTVWPGDEYVDAAGPDFYDYDQAPDRRNSTTGAPEGIRAWADFVVGGHHTPFVMGEWGLEHGVDDPAFIDQVFDVLEELKAQGMLAYASYFALNGCTHQIHVGGCNPNATAAYQARAREW